MNEPLVNSRLEARHLKKDYGSRKVVHDVSVQVGKGEVVGLLGPNGAGKTTSFYMIVGLVRGDGGQILIDGQDVTRMPIHKRSRMGLSYLPQEASIFRKLSVADNVRAILELQTDAQGAPLNSEAVEKRLTDLLKDLRVDHLRDSPAVALSGGERRRVEIARALATSPRARALRTSRWAAPSRPAPTRWPTTISTDSPVTTPSAASAPITRERSRTSMPRSAMSQPTT